MSAEERELQIQDMKIFKLLFMSKDAILKMHHNDFSSFAYQKLPLEEVCYKFLTYHY